MGRRCQTDLSCEGWQGVYPFKLPDDWNKIPYKEHFLYPAVTVEKFYEYVRVWEYRKLEKVLQQVFGELQAQEFIIIDGVIREYHTGHMKISDRS